MPLAKNFRNIAIVAHVDHGKTTLVDHLLRQSGTFRDPNQVEERLMDSMDLEKERGITIAAKNASFMFNDIKVNIVDTPGHSDFGGEVERILDMVDGAVLLVDACEGPLPQTRFVLRKALEKKIKIFVCINKIDRADSRIEDVLNEIFDLFIDLDASDEQADFDVIYTIAKKGIAVLDPSQEGKSLDPLFEWIVEKLPPPEIEPDEPVQILVSNIDYDDYLGRLAIGRLRSGSLSVGQNVQLCQENGTLNFKVSGLFSHQGNQRSRVEKVESGDIVVVAGMEKISIGDTITDVTNPRPLPRLYIEEPTVGVLVSVNDGPFSGLDGKQVTSRKIRERFDKELRYNVALRVQDTDSAESWEVIGRGELQLSILFEQMRREGFEVLVGKPHVTLQKSDQGIKEPMEIAVIDVEERFFGAVAQGLGERKGVLISQENKGTSRTRAEFRIPSRGLIGYRSDYLTVTRGTGLLSTYFDGYDDFRGAIEGRKTGAIISDRKGKATAYALWCLEDRGRLLVSPGTEVYSGMIIGEATKGIDLEVNVCREKKLSNVRASGADEAIKLTPVRPLTLEQSLEWIKDNEIIEVTPKNIRIRCRELDPHKRKK